MTVTLNPTPEQVQIRDAARAMLETHYPIDRMDMLSPLAPLAEFGAFALSLPEEAGGAGFSLVDEAMLHVELGRHLLSPSALAASVAAQFVVGTDCAPRLDEIVAGALPVAAGVAAREGVLLLAEEMPALAVVSGKDGLALVELSGCTAVASAGMGGPVLELAAQPQPVLRAPINGRIASHWQLLVSAQLLGIAEKAMDLTVDYVQTREQFGRPIGSFQAIKHRCADMAIGCHRLSALLDLAAISVEEGKDEAAFNSAALATLAPTTALANARAAIQLHGGVGFSAEAAPHLFLKQAHVLASLLLPPDMSAAPAPLAPLKASSE